MDARHADVAGPTLAMGLPGGDAGLLRELCAVDPEICQVTETEGRKMSLTANPPWDRVARGLQFTNDRAIDLKTITLRISYREIEAKGIRDDQSAMNFIAYLLRQYGIHREYIYKLEIQPDQFTMSLLVRVLVPDIIFSMVRSAGEDMRGSSISNDIYLDWSTSNTGVEYLTTSQRNPKREEKKNKKMKRSIQF